MKRFLLLCFVFLGVQTYAQTWSDDVAQIVYDKCAKCHHTGGIGGFSLTTYSETSPMAAAIYDAVNDNQMPPWPPDNNYQQYVHDRSLSASQKTTILNWIDAGYPEGNSANTPPPPVFSDENILGNGDLTVQMPTYMSKATFSDDYACFSVPSGLLQNRTIKSIEIIPGNREIVHHALIFLDPTGAEVTDSVGGDCASPGNSSTKLMAGYTPGATPMTLPSTSPLKLGFNIPANSNIYFAMHYPAGSYGLYDSTKVIFHFYPEGTTGIRQISADPILQNWSFNLPANQVTGVFAQYPAGAGTLPYNISLLSVFPHMHLLGQSIRTFGIKSNGDTLKLSNIPHWDFHWQDFYFFKNIQLAPAGAKLKAQGVYDNTSANPNNPNNPPQNVYAGLNTSDEMFLVYFHYMQYQAGDETYDMEELMSASLNEQLAPDNSPVTVYPNPFEESTTIAYDTAKSGDIVSVYIYDYQGKLISKVMEHETISGNGLSVNWNGKNMQGSEVRKGVYFVSLNVNGENITKQLIKN